MTVPRDAYNPAEDATCPAFECSAYHAMLADLQIVNDCYEGTTAIAARAADYDDASITSHRRLPYLRKFGAESPQDYSMRLATSKFWNAFRRMVHGNVGLIFRKNPDVQDDLPEQIKSQLQDVDLQGTHLDVFLKERCVKGMVDGHTFIYVDEPEAVKTSGNASGKPTAADEVRTARRPYWVPVNKDQIVNWRVEKIEGVDVLTQVTIRECVLEPLGEFGEEAVSRYRVLRPGSYEVHQYDEESKSWIVVAEGTTPLSYIPLVPFYTQQIGFFQSTPPLLDVAHENLRHYNLQSGLDRVLDLCNVPTPVLKGRPDPNVPLIVGDGVIDVPTDGGAFFLEPTGVAIATTQNEIDRCKANIAALGLLLLGSQPKVTKTATETVYESTAETSELAAIARNLQDCAERCVRINADYLNIPLSITEEGGIRISRDFVKVGLDPMKWQRLQDDVASGRLTVETYWAVLDSAEELPSEFNAEDEKTALAARPTLTALQVERAKVGLAADKQAMSGNPADIQQRILDKAANAPASIS